MLRNCNAGLELYPLRPLFANCPVLSRKGTQKECRQIELPKANDQYFPEKKRIRWFNLRVGAECSWKVVIFFNSKENRE